MMRAGKQSVTEDRTEGATGDEGGYARFWLDYLAEHRQPGTRAWHYAGTGGALLMLAAAAAGGSPWLVGAAVVTGYGCAWLGHARVEHNRPLTFRHPLWSLASDVRLCAMFLAGRLDAELRRAGLDHRGKNG
jgi:hypothetical protein